MILNGWHGDNLRQCCSDDDADDDDDDDDEHGDDDDASCDVHVLVDPLTAPDASPDGSTAPEPQVPLLAYANQEVPNICEPPSDPARHSPLRCQQP